MTDPLLFCFDPISKKVNNTSKNKTATGIFEHPFKLLNNPHV